jgi:DNA helicase-2/ATP-dependent DNA helicase PcrA
MHDSAAKTRKALEGLDPNQAAMATAVREGKGNVAAIAGAGSGKTHTTVVTGKALVDIDGKAPERLCFTTFTRKASDELKERFGRIAPRLGHCGTMHSLARRVLADADPQRWDMRRCVDADGRMQGIPAADYLWRDILTWSPKGIPGLGKKGLNVELGYGQSAKDYALAAGIIRGAGHAFGSDVARRAAARVPLDRFDEAWALYEEAKAALGAWDFADALQGLADLLASDKGPSFDLVFVDEAQDNSKVQVAIAQGLARNGRLVVVGDGRQSIYEWRGATPETFLGFAEADGWTTVYLPTNYRSGSRIVAAGNATAAGQSWSLGPESVAHRHTADGFQGSVSVQGAADAFDEAAMVAERIAGGMEAGDSADGFAILCRTNNAAAIFETALMEAKIPCTRVGATPFFERAAAKDFMSWLLLAEGDNFEAIKRVYNKPKRYLGKAFLQALQARLDRGEDIVSACIAVAPGLRGGSRQGARDLATDIRRLRAMPYAERVEATRVLLAKQAGPEDAEKLQAGDSARDMISVCAAIAGRFDNAVAFVRYADECTKNTMRSNDVKRGRVTISTVHRAKGLEWETVFVSAPAGTFPHGRSEGDKRRMAEERRLFYVAVTRARDTLVVTHSDVDAKGKAAGLSPFTSEYVMPLTEEA